MIRQLFAAPQQIVWHAERCAGQQVQSAAGETSPTPGAPTPDYFWGSTIDEALQLVTSELRARGEAV